MTDETLSFDDVTYPSPGPADGYNEIPEGRMVQDVLGSDGKVRPIELSDTAVAARIVLPGAQRSPRAGQQASN